MNDAMNIDRCPGCNEPCHASEGNEDGYHEKCIPVTAPKLTEAQRKALASYERNEHVPLGTHRALHRLGLVSMQGYSFKLTDAGRAALRGDK